MKRISNFINSCVGVGILMQSVAGFCATKLSVEEIYNYASQKNMRELKKLKNSLDSVDSEGNTALCQAILNKDVKTYNALVRAGANTSAACIKNIPQTTYNNFMTSVAQSGIAGGDVATAGSATATATPTTGTFLGMGALGWGITGAVVAGGIAAAAGGGGGGGAGGASAGGSAATCGGNICGIHSHCSNNVCVCDDGYGKNTSGVCIKKSEDLVLKSTLPTNLNNSDLSVNNTDEYKDIYGIKCSSDYIHNAYNYSMADLVSGYIGIGNYLPGNVYGIYGTNNESVYNSYVALMNVPATAEGLIIISNLSSGDSYGILTTSGSVYNAFSNFSGDSLGAIQMDNNSEGASYGIKATGDVYNSYTYNYLSQVDPVVTKADGRVTITNLGNGDIFGIYSNGTIYNSYTRASVYADGTNSQGLIEITTNGSGNSYGIYQASTSDVYNAYAISDTDTVNSTAEINIHNNGNGKVYGIYAPYASGIHNTYLSGEKGTVSGTINIQNKNSGVAFGIYGKNILTKSNSHTTSTINMDNQSDGIGIGISALDNGQVYNSGIIRLYSSNSSSTGLSVGIFSGQNVNIVNSGNIQVSGADVAYGIYAKGNGGTITNSGTIDVKATNAYGIFVENGAGTTVYNTGTIKLNDVACTGDCSGNTTNRNYIVLNGGTLLNAGTMSAQSFNTASVGGNVVATTHSKWNIANDFSGMLGLSANLTTHGFNTTYIAKDMIQAGDTSGLKLKSQSALFDASLQGSDVVMRMKNFETVTTNSSFAQFLATNYALGQNEAFFNTLKQIGSVSELTSGLDKMMGKEMLSRFNFEDMTMMRELNFDMNEKLFNNKEQNFASTGSVSSMAFKGDTGSNAKYSLYNKRSGNTSIGLGVAFTNVRSDDEHDNNSRHDLSYQMIVPIGYRIHGFNLMTSPRLGYARGSYDRTGFDNKSYDGTIEKRIFGLMNEARYPFMLGSWKFEPSVEFNALGYEQRGSEKKKEYSLVIPKQTTYSVESGVGLYMTHETELDKDSIFKLTAGISAYHEFADPYKVDVAMNGLTGHFTLRDENRSNNRAVVRTGFEFDKEDYSILGSFISYVDREVRSKANLGFKWKF